MRREVGVPRRIQAHLGGDIRPPVDRHVFQYTADSGFRLSLAIGGGGVDPVNPAGARAVDQRPFDIVGLIDQRPANPTAANG